MDEPDRINPQPIILFILLDILIPISLILNSISILNIVGLLIIVIALIHVASENLIKKSFTGIRIMQYVEIFVSFICIVFAVLQESNLNLNNNIIEYLSFHFSSAIQKGTSFPLTTCVIPIR